MQRAALWFLVACCLLPAGLHAQTDPARAVEIVRETGRVPVWPELRIVVPEDRNLSPEGAAELAAGSRAVGVDSPNRVLGRGLQPYWALFSIHNPEDSAQLRFLVLESTTQYDVRLYKLGEAGQWRRLGSVAEQADGSIGGGTVNPQWMLQLAPRAGGKFLLRLEGPSLVRFPLFAYTPSKFVERARRIQVALGFALGCCLFIGIYILYLRRFLVDRTVPLFICMLIGDLLGALWLSGVLGEFLPAAPESVLSHLGFGGFAVLFGCGCMHARIYLGTAVWLPRTDRLLQVLGWSWLALLPWFPMAFPVAARILLVWGGTIHAVILVITAVAVGRKARTQSGFITVAWVSNLLMVGYFAVVRALDDPDVWSPSSLVLIQATAMAVLFGFAMSQRLVGQRVVLAAARREAVLQQEKTAALMRERSMLFAATNHDLRQPLHGVSIFADLLKSARTPEERQKYTRKLDSAIAEVDGLLVGIQQLAQVHEGSTPPPAETIALDALLRPIVEEYRSRSSGKDIPIRYLPTRLSISTYPPYFQRIVRNALANAVRYTEPGDRILVACRRGGGLRLVIADTGPGMSEEQSRRAFDAFQRFAADEAVRDGFGLGLFSAKTLAHALGLEIALQSHAGRGTVFSVYLPAAERIDL